MEENTLYISIEYLSNTTKKLDTLFLLC